MSEKTAEKLTVGVLRQRSALCDADTVPELVADDPELRAFLAGLELQEAYPDTVNGAGEWKRSFKIKVRRRQ